MWRDIDAALLREELDVLRQHGLRTTRSFLFWPDVMPEPARLDDQVLRRFEVFLDLHHELGMRTIPTFLVGHMSGENWDPVWRDGRSLYADTWMVARQAWYLREVTSRLHAHPAVTGWLVSNEMPIYAGEGDTPVVSAWAQLMIHAVRAGGGTQPISVGDGAWGIEMTGKDTGFSIRELGEFTDFVGPHVYPMETDPVRQQLRAAFTCELASVSGQPVVLEEFGVTSDFASDDHAASYYRQVLHSSLLAGASGWLAWNNTDFDNLEDQDPYRHHPFEMHFGLTLVDGAAKPQLREMRRFAQLLDRIGFANCTRWPSQVALLVPAYLELGRPFTSAEAERTYVLRCTEQAYVACREADLPPGIVRERDGVDDGYLLYLVPSVKALTAPTWRTLERIARGGATVFASYGSGEVESQRGPWWTGLESIFGVRHRLRYGLAERVEQAEVSLRFEQDFGTLRRGDVLRFPVSGGEHARVRLPVQAAGATVLARDQAGRIALVRHEIGDGAAVLCTYPVEYFAAARPNANPEDTWRLYEALAAAAGVRRRAHVEGPEVTVDGLDGGDGRRFAWLVNQSPEPQDVRLETADGFRPVPIGGGERSTRVKLPGYGVEVLQIEPARADDKWKGL